MLPPRIESTRVRRKRSRKGWLLLPLAAVIGILAYFYGEETMFAIRQRFLPENLQLLEARIAHVEKQFTAHANRLDSGLTVGYAAFTDEEREQINAYLRDSRRILGFYQSSSKTNAELQTAAAVFQFYELLLYVHLNEKSLLDLAGREFLPPLSGIKADGFREKARSALLLARKSLAMDAAQRRADDLRLIEVMSDLLYNERTDPYLFQRLASIDHEKISAGLKPAYGFASLSLFVRSGNKERMNQILSAGNPSDSLSQMLRIYGLFYARDYILAMQLARNLLIDERIDRSFRSEAARMLGEIFRIQGGKGAGLPYLYQARELQPDPFLDDLIRQWQQP
jgi:hypothetical protein